MPSFRPHEVEPAIWRFLQFNPLLVTIDQARRSLLWHQSLDFGALGYIYGCAAVSLCIGYFIFSVSAPSSPK